MKNIKFRSFLLGVCLLPALVVIQGQNKSFIDVWGGAGYSSLYHGIEGSKVPGGLGAELGVGYELNINQVLFLAGVEFQYLNSSTKLNGYQENRNYLYLPIADHEITYKYTFSEYKEKHQVGFVNIPIQVGYRFNRYYFLAGAKVGLGIFSNYKTNSSLNISIEDSQFIDIIQNAGHGSGQYPFNDKGKFDVGFNVAPTLEFGLYLDEWMGTFSGERRVGPSYRASIFADCGLMNLNKGNTDNSILTEPRDNPADVSVNSLLSSSLAKDKRLGNWIVGLKFTVLFSLPGKTPPPSSLPSKSDFYARVVDSKTNQVVDAEVELSMTTGKKEKIFKQRTDADGVVMSPDLRHTRYQITAEADGYVNYRKYIRHIKSDTILVPMTPIPVLYVQVYDQETRRNLGAEITVSAVMPGNTQTLKGNTDPLTGMYGNSIRSGRYQVSAVADGYFYKQEVVNHTGTDTLYLALQPVPKEKPMVLQDLLFEFGTANIIPESEKSLDELAELLTNNPELHIEITGHTDNVGSASYNLNLSRERALAVYNRLVEKGIDPARLSYDGKGDTQPITMNDTEEGRQQNRRVEFRILDTPKN